MGKRLGVGLFIGRFQPFHKGHMYALRYALSSCRWLIIGIGSAQEHGTESNPISSKDRIRIIKAAIYGTGIDSERLKFFKIPDFDNNAAWFSYIIKRYPKIEVVFSRTRLVKSIFNSHGIRVVAPPWYRRRTLAATKIRETIKKGRRWQHNVPEGAVRYIEAQEKTIRNSKGIVRPRIR